MPYGDGKDAMGRSMPAERRMFSSVAWTPLAGKRWCCYNTSYLSLSCSTCTEEAFVPGSAVEKVIIRRLDGTLVVGAHSLIQPGLDADIVLYPSLNGAGPLSGLVPTFTLCPALPWEGGAMMHCALPGDWQVFPEPSASNSVGSQAQYIAVRRGDEGLMLQFIPPMSQTSCHQHLGTTEVIAGLAGQCYYHHITPSGSKGAGRVAPTGVLFSAGTGHCLWTHERPAINIITMRGRNVLLPMSTGLVMDMSDHVPVEPPRFIRARNCLR